MQAQHQSTTYTGLKAIGMLFALSGYTLLVSPVFLAKYLYDRFFSARISINDLVKWQESNSPHHEIKRILQIAECEEIPHEIWLESHDITVKRALEYYANSLAINTSYEESQELIREALINAGFNKFYKMHFAPELVPASNNMTELREWIYGENLHIERQTQALHLQRARLDDLIFGLD